MTKSEIVQELLDKGHITAEKAVVLLTNETPKGGITYIPYQPNPYWPTEPNIPSQPWYTTNTHNLNKKEDE